MWRSIEAKHLSQALNQIRFDGLILDLGCGEGKVSSVIFKENIDVGLDIDIAEIKKAKLIKSYKSLILGHACSLPFADESFGLVFSNCVIEHIPHVKDVLREVSRVLKLGGYFVFTVPSENFGSYLFFYNLFSKVGLKKLARYYSTKRNEYLNHYSVFSENAWAKKLKDINLEVVTTHQYLSKSAMRIWDLLAFIGFLCRKIQLNRLSTLLKAILNFNKVKIGFFSQILKKYYEGGCDKGGGLLIVAQKYGDRKDG